MKNGTFIGFDYQTKSSALSFEENIFIGNVKSYISFRGCKQTKCFFPKKVAQKMHPCTNVWSRHWVNTFSKKYLKAKETYYSKKIFICSPDKGSIDNLLPIY